MLSIGIFFTLMIVGLSTTLTTTMVQGLESHGLPAAVAIAVGQLPPVSILFAAFLGYRARPWKPANRRSRDGGAAPALKRRAAGRGDSRRHP